MGIYIGKGREELRAAHWRDIQTRVKTHEGELLSGDKGKSYQQKWSGKYLGRDLSSGRPADKKMVEEFEAKQSKENE